MEGNETVTICHQLKLRAEDGKMRLTYKTRAIIWLLYYRCFVIRYNIGLNAREPRNHCEARMRLIKTNQMKK